MIGEVQLQEHNAVQCCSINEITTVQCNFQTNEIVSSVSEFPMATLQYPSSQGVTICDKIVYVFSGFVAQDASITTKPNISPTLFAFSLDKKSLSKQECKL